MLSALSPRAALRRIAKEGVKEASLTSLRMYEQLGKAEQEMEVTLHEELDGLLSGTRIVTH